MFQHNDNLDGLNHNGTLNAHLEVIHGCVKQKFPFIGRIAVASYDKKTGMLKTFIASNSRKVELVRYEAELESASSLQDILKMGRPRVVNDLSIFDQGLKNHTQVIKKDGFSASYTLPMYQNGNFLGFIFFNSDQVNCFSEDVLFILDIHAHLISSHVAHELSVINTLLGALKTANRMVHSRDPETAGHTERMASFSRLIAQYLASNGKYQFNDEFIEHLFLFAPMHDIGKIGIPDDILLKPGKLTPEETLIMQSHTTKGRELVNDMIENFGLDAFQYIDVLRNIAACHHEVLDGSGYPSHLKGKEIPIEARIIAVADIFDALTSARPYKLPWTNEDAFELLKKLSKDKLDKDCVDALFENIDRVVKIQKSFHGSK
ncbi:MAG: HD domain-containing protein [Bacteroidetes bacterium]|nr:HD domain-containing protein [Bacteroidota bacterium]